MAAMAAAPNIRLYKGDLPAGLRFDGPVAVDSETMGLNPGRDRLCLVQLSAGDGVCHLVQIAKGQAEAPNIAGILADPSILKLFHFGRFDIAVFLHRLGVLTTPVYCTKIASKLARTMTDGHSLKDLCGDLLGIEISKRQQTSDWGAEELGEDQRLYAAADVLYLHRLKVELDGLLEREGRAELARKCFEFLPYRAALDIAGWAEGDIFAHS